MKSENQNPKSCQATTGRLILLALVISAACCLDSCTPCYYAPAAQNVPLMKAKKDFRASGALKLGTMTWGCDFQGAVAASNHVGLMMNYSHYAGRESAFDNTTLSNSSGNTIEVGAGYYLPFKEHFVFETYTGYTHSKVSTAHDSYLDLKESEVKNWGLFLQPAIGIHRKNIELALSTRLRMIDYTSLTYKDYQKGEVDPVLLELENLPNLFFVEPAFTFRAGGESVKFQMQVGFSAPINDCNYPAFDPFNLNFGIVFYVQGKKKSSEF